MKILKTNTKTGTIFSANIDRRKTNPLIYVKYWKQVCLPSLLFGSEIFSLTPTLISRLERCQRWFLKIIFRVPNLPPVFFSVFLLKDWLVLTQLNLRLSTASFFLLVDYFLYQTYQLLLKHCFELELRVFMMRKYHPRSTVVLLDTGTPGTSREIYSEDADGETRTRNPLIKLNSFPAIAFELYG